MGDNASFNMFVELNNQRIPLETGQLYLLGKQINGLDNKTNKHFIELEGSEEIEQKHCVIDVGQSEDVFVYDLFSLKGTKLNDNPLKGLEKIRLKNGDILRVGQQEIKYFHEQQEVSHDSSGFLEVNRNTSDIIASSPDSTSQTENRLKRNNYINFLVPSIPAKKSVTPNTSIVISETEAVNISRNSLNASFTSETSNNRRSDSFTIPETQHCKPRNSLNASDLSIAESIPDYSGNQIKFNLDIPDNFDDDEDFIPETQEVLPPLTTGGISCSQRPRLLSNAKERSALLEESSNSHELDGSQFRICTQDYNEGFGEEAEAMQSQIIPIIKHNTVILNTSANKSCNDKSQMSLKSYNESANNQCKSIEEEKELSTVKWPDDKINQGSTESRADCSTPDIFEFADEEPLKSKEQMKTAEQEKCDLEAAITAMEEDEEDLMPTQAFPLSSAKIVIKTSLKEHDKPCLDKEPEEILTLSDKENRCPVTLEPITDLPPTQLFATNEVSSTRSSSSSASRNSLNGLKTNTQSTVENKNNMKSSLLNLELNLDDDDEEDAILTQAFLQPSNPPIVSSTSNNSNKNIPTKCFNSTVLEDKFITKNPHTFFAEMEKTPSKQNTTTSSTSTPPQPPPATAAATDFKKPDNDKVVLKKAPSVISTISGNDLDLLMCTPQLIKEHMFVDKTEDLKKDILAAKNRNLFGEETDEDKDDEEDDDPEELVKLINKPKDTLDFDKLLPHLNKKSPESPKKKEEKHIKEENKIHKFNLSFGKEHEEKQISVTKSSTLSRDERHAARDKERELEERKQRSKTHKRNSRKQKEIEETKTFSKEDDNIEQYNTDKPNKTRQHGKRQAKNDKTKETEIESKSKETEKESKSKDDKKEQKSSHKYERKRQTKEVKGLETAKITKIEKEATQEHDRTEPNSLHKHDRKRQTKESKSETKKESKVEENQNEMPGRRMTRAKSKLEEVPTISKVTINSKMSDETTEGDDLDSVATQPFVVRVARRRSTTKQSESQNSIASNSSSRKSAQQNKSKNDSSLSHNTSANKSLTKKSSGERKRKAEPTPVEIPEKVERKRLRSTHSQDSSAATTITTSSNSSKILISMTMVDHELFKNLMQNSKGIWHVAKDPVDSEILVMDKAFRTFKFFLAMARGIPIVTSEYLHKLNQTQSVKKVKIQDYLFADAEFEKKHKCSLIKSQQVAKKHKLFKGYEFVMTANISPNPREIQAMIEISGGFVYEKTPPAPKDNQKIYLVTSKEDKKDWHKYRRLNKDIIIVSTEAIMSAIMRQSCESMSSYTLA